MQLQTVEIPRAGAREAAADYLREAKRISDPERRAEFEEIARVYRLAARDELPLIALTPTLIAGGTTVRTLRSYGWKDGQRVETSRSNYLLPKLAVIRASASFVYTLGVQRNGAVEFCDRMTPSVMLVKGRHDVRPGSFELPPDFIEGRSLLGDRWRSNAWSAMVPICPPKHRPAGSSSLAAYHVLWEVDKWEWVTVPPPPGDPALLRHVGGDIYAVVATWDLTPLEQLVLQGRQP